MGTQRLLISQYIRDLSKGSWRTAPAVKTLPPAANITADMIMAELNFMKITSFSNCPKFLNCDFTVF